MAGEEFEVLRGIGAQLNVDADSILFQRLFLDLSRSGIQPVEPENVHITLVDTYETRIPILSIRDEAAIDSARAMASEYLLAHVKAGIVLVPDVDKLEPFGHKRQKVSIPLKNDSHEFVCDLREDVSNIFLDEAKITLLGTRRFVPHVKIGTKLEDFKRMHEDRAPFKRNKHRIPKNLVVNGFTVTDRYEEASDPDEASNGRPLADTRGDNRYRNKPKALRRA